MSNSNSELSIDFMFGQIVEYVTASSGLLFKNSNELIVVSQKVDSKKISINKLELSEILQRHDSEGKPFIQVNFIDGAKILLTDNLIGFKPKEVPGLDMTKIPKVVTTPDLFSVLDAIEDSLSSEVVTDHEVDILKKVFSSILVGAESVGFDLSFEKNLLNSLSTCRIKATA